MKKSTKKEKAKRIQNRGAKRGLVERKRRKKFVRMHHRSQHERAKK